MKKDQYSRGIWKHPNYHDMTTKMLRKWRDLYRKERPLSRWSNSKRASILDLNDDVLDCILGLLDINETNTLFPNYSNRGSNDGVPPPLPVRTLANISLTCHRLRALSMRHLFRHVYVGPWPGYVWNKKRIRCTLRPDLELFCRSKAIHPHVRVLRISISKEHYCRSLAKALSRLPRLLTLDFWVFGYAKEYEVAFYPHLKVMPTVTTLFIDTASEPLLACFPNLERLCSRANTPTREIDYLKQSPYAPRSDGWEPRMLRQLPTLFPYLKHLAVIGNFGCEWLSETEAIKRYRLIPLLKPLTELETVVFQFQDRWGGGFIIQPNDQNFVEQLIGQSESLEKVWIGSQRCANRHGCEGHHSRNDHLAGLPPSKWHVEWTYEDFRTPLFRGAQLRCYDDGRR